MHLAFADCVLDLEARRLTRAGAEVPLEPKMFALLDVLIKRRPAVVTHQELDELLWPKAYVSRSSLTRLVSELRALLGDDSNEVRIIRTVHKTGYAFRADVKPTGKPRQVPAAILRLWSGRSLLLHEGENVAGRDAVCEVMLDATTVSRRHACFRVAAGVITVEDLGSANGTFVNGASISSATELSDGDKIELGKAILTLRLIAPPATTEMMARTDHVDNLITPRSPP